MSKHIKVTMPVALFFVKRMMADDLDTLILEHGSDTDEKAMCVNDIVVEFLEDVVKIIKDNPDLNLKVI